MLLRLIDDRELKKLENRCTYDEDNKKWTIPHFTVGGREVNFPKFGGPRDIRVKRLNLGTTKKAE